MTDLFAIFQEPRRPWIESDSLKAKFLNLSSEVHPDRTHNAPEAERKAAHERYTELNSAYQCLREPKTRLSHLLELELGVKPGIVYETPEALVELFFEVGKLCREVDAFLSDKEGVTSPIAKVEWFEKGLDWIEKLNRFQEDIANRQSSHSAELKEMNGKWELADGMEGDGRRESLPLNEVGEIHRAFGFTSRWSQQLRERVVKLSF